MLVIFKGYSNFFIFFFFNIVIFNGFFILFVILVKNNVGVILIDVGNWYLLISFF